MVCPRVVDVKAKNNYGVLSESIRIDAREKLFSLCFFIFFFSPSSVSSYIQPVVYRNSHRGVSFVTVIKLVVPSGLGHASVKERGHMP